MRRYGSGYDFEDAVFGRHSSGDLFERFGAGRANFSADLLRAIGSSESAFPDTKIGRSLHGLLSKCLDEQKIDPVGLVFVSTVNTKIDLNHYCDGFFFLPSLPNLPITIDAFCIGEKRLWELKNFWIDIFNGHHYSLFDLQNDLFLYKRGLTRWRAEKPQLGFVSTEMTPLSILPDFRRYADHGRPENHFILTPEYATAYEGRRFFSTMLAKYFAKVLRS
jgi:hypothetical protein